MRLEHQKTSIPVVFLSFWLPAREKTLLLFDPSPLSNFGEGDSTKATTLNFFLNNLFGFWLTVNQYCLICPRLPLSHTMSNYWLNWDHHITIVITASLIGERKKEKRGKVEFYFSSLIQDFIFFKKICGATRQVHVRRTDLASHPNFVDTLEPKSNLADVSLNV